MIDYNVTDYQKESTGDDDLYITVVLCCLVILGLMIVPLCLSRSKVYPVNAVSFDTSSGLPESPNFILAHYDVPDDDIHKDAIEALPVVPLAISISEVETGADEAVDSLETYNTIRQDQAADIHPLSPSL